MKLIGNLQDAVQHDLAWRKREISDLRSDVAKSDISTGYLFRFGQILLCAHWEGFLKKSAQLYIDHIFSQDLILREFIPNIIAIKYFDLVTTAAASKYPGSEAHHIKLAKSIASTIDSKIKAPGWHVNTEGNPGSDALERILRAIGINPQLGMDAARWAITKIFINEHLVRDRSQIAHGEGTPIERSILLERSEKLLQLLDLLSSQILDNAQRMSYKTNYEQ